MSRKGFTLLELLIVIIILGILAAVALPRYISTVESGRRAEAFATMKSLRDADLAEYARVGSYFAAGAIPAAGWGVNIDGITGNEIEVIPNSNNFTFSVTGTDNTRYYTSTPKTGAGTVTYHMCTVSGRTTSGAAVPSCP